MNRQCETHGGRKQLQFAVLAFVEKVKSDLGIKALHRELEQIDGTYALRESGETGTLTGVKPGKYTLELRVVTFGSQR